MPTIQRMEASDGVVRGNVDSLMKLIGALNAAGIELIGEGTASQAAAGAACSLKLTPKLAPTHEVVITRWSSEPALRCRIFRIFIDRARRRGDGAVSAPRRR